MIKLSRIFKEYSVDGGKFSALSGINLTIKKGEFLAIVGPSGSGKSTLMHLIGLLDTPTRGKIEIEGRAVSRLSDSELSHLRNEFIGFVFQQFNLINKLTVLENILLPAAYRWQRKDMHLNLHGKEKAFNLMKRFEIDSKACSYPASLSGGQQQRVAIARALINDPLLILADEPTGNLDTKTGGIILGILEELNRKDKMTVVVVTHDPQIAKKAKRQIEMVDGKIVNTK